MGGVDAACGLVLIGAGVFLSTAGVVMEGFFATGAFLGGTLAANLAGVLGGSVLAALGLGFTEVGGLDAEGSSGAGVGNLLSISSYHSCNFACTSSLCRVKNAALVATPANTEIKRMHLQMRRHMDGRS